MKNKLLFFFILFWALSFSACFPKSGQLNGELKGSSGSLANPLRELTKEQALSAFYLDVGDVIEIRVHGEPELTNVYQIYPACVIQFPMIKKVKVCGRTPNAIQEEIATRLQKDYFQQRPAVSVKVKEFNSKKIHIFGQVAKPGRFDYTKGLTLLQAIATAGGFTAKAAKNSTRLIRTIDGVRKIYNIPLGDLGKRKVKDLFLRPGDIIYVPESWL